MTWNATKVTAWLVGELQFAYRYPNCVGGELVECDVKALVGHALGCLPLPHRVDYLHDAAATAIDAFKRWRSQQERTRGVSLPQPSASAESATPSKQGKLL